ncbi:MAG TPA: tetraacyldisaccharide 4'-kinase, partial [Aquabacterium sp.]|nr:tetraacyldisaccharide 4'-kinase [Aquabacterium sp.]
MAYSITESWQKRGITSTALLPVAAVYGGLTALRRWCYRVGWLRSTRLPCPVLVVGNRIAGGAGKTPTTIAILEHLQSLGWHPGVLTRGYKAADAHHPRPLLLDDESEGTLTTAATGDEPMLIWRRTGVPIMIDPVRTRGGQALLKLHPEVDILVCDDG